MSFREQTTKGLQEFVKRLLQRPGVREFCSRYVEENPAANKPGQLVHALIAPLCRGPRPFAEGPDDWTELHGWIFLELFLLIGAHTGGVHLSSAECQLVREILSGERKPPIRRGRRRDKRVVHRDSLIAGYIESLEAKGWPPDAAVARAKEVYGVARQTVFTAKKKRREVEALFGPLPHGTGEFYEREAAERWRRQKRPRRSSPT